MRVFKSFSHLLDQGYWFSDNRVSAFASQRTGGINQIDYHGKQPVSRNAKIFQRDDGVLLFSVVVEEDGSYQEYPLTFDFIQLYPFGFKNSFTVSGYECVLEMVLYRKMLAFRVGVKKKEPKLRTVSFKVRLNEASLSTEVHGNRKWEQAHIREDGTVLFRATNKVTVKEWTEKMGAYLVNEEWQRRIFKKGTGQLRSRYERSNLLLFDATICAVIGGHHFTSVEEREGWIEFSSVERTVANSTVPIPFVVAFGDTEDEAERNHRIACNEHRIITASQRKRYEKLQRNAPRLRLEPYPEIEELFRVTPQIVESAKIPEKGVTRACQSSYYWVWGWDNLATGNEISKWGDSSFLRKMAAFFSTHRALDGSTPHRYDRDFKPLQVVGFGCIDFLYVSLLMNLYANTGDKEVLESFYPTIKIIFTKLAKQSDAKGFYKTLGMYPDFPRRLGRNERSYVAMEIGTWYCTCRMVEEIAVLLDDARVAKQARTLHQRIQSSFCKAFFDEDVAFLADSIDTDSRRRQETYPLFSLMFLHSALGFSLLGDRMKTMADFVAKNFLVEHGLALLPQWDRHAGSEISTSSWYPHWDIYAIKLLRRAGDSNGLLRWLGLVQDCYRRLGYCPEFVSLKPEDIHPERRWLHHGSPWNLNCATGWYKAMVEGVVGIESDFGGLTYLPCRLPFPIELQGLHFRRTLWNIKITGEGSKVERIVVDGKEVEGTYKLPRRCYRAGRHTLEVHYGMRQRQELILRELRGGELIAIQSAQDSLGFRMKGFGTVTAIFSAPSKPRLLSDGRERELTWNERTLTAEADIFARGEHTLRIVCPQY